MNPYRFSSGEIAFAIVNGRNIIFIDPILYIPEQQTTVVDSMELINYQTRMFCLFESSEINFLLRSLIVIFLKVFKIKLKTVFSRTIAGSSNGRTADFESVNHGSNPCPAATHEAIK